MKTLTLKETPQMNGEIGPFKLVIFGPDIEFKKNGVINNPYEKTLNDK
jgi:hypothetical protein